MPTLEKEQTVEQLRERVQRAAGVYLVEYKGLNVRDISELRKQVRQADAQMIVVKNRLLKLAIEGTPAAALEPFLKGPNAAFFCEGDAFAPAKTIEEFAKTHEVLKWKGGFVDGLLMDGAGMSKIASLPPKTEILAGVVGGVAAPLTGLVFTLSGLVSDLVYTLQAVADKREGAAA